MLHEITYIKDIPLKKSHENVRPCCSTTFLAWADSLAIFAIPSVVRT